jgi:imidazolonepropionase-like amidohydrolase
MATTNIKIIKAGMLIDGTGKSPVENVKVLVENSVIKAVGQDIEIPKDAQVIDATGKTVMPGLIDSHVHFHGKKPDDTEMDPLSRPREIRLIKAVFDAKKRLATGFTTSKDCGGMYGVFLKQAAAEKIISGIPRIVAAGYELQNTEVSHYSYLSPEYLDARTSRIEGQVGGEKLICDGVDECIKATRYAISRGSDFIKVVSSDEAAFNLDEMKAIVQTAGQVNKYVTIHCDTPAFAKRAIQAGVKTVDHAIGMDEEAIEMGNRAGVIFVSTLAVMKAEIDYASGPKMTKDALQKAEWGKGKLEKMVSSYIKVRKLGGTLAIGTDFGGGRLAENYNVSAVEMELLVKYCNFTPMEAIVAASKNGALACFMGEKFGTIEPGKFADIIVVDGDPLTNIAVLQDLDKIKLVMLEGKIEVDKDARLQPPD